MTAYDHVRPAPQNKGPQPHDPPPHRPVRPDSRYPLARPPRPENPLVRESQHQNLGPAPEGRPETISGPVRHAPLDLSPRHGKIPVVLQINGSFQLKTGGV